MYGEWTGYDAAFKELEPGTVVFLKMIEDLCRCGAREIDFGPGDASYKRRLGDRTVAERPTNIFAPTPRGVLLNFLMSIEVLTNRWAKYVARKMKFLDAIKRFWRDRKLRALRKISPVPKPEEPSDRSQGVTC
jgi:CelD/BcsL family acetyltransferase involved in cellulose biosynthesis